MEKRLDDIEEKVDELSATVNKRSGAFEAFKESVESQLVEQRDHKSKLTILDTKFDSFCDTTKQSLKYITEQLENNTIIHKLNRDKILSMLWVNDVKNTFHKALVTILVALIIGAAGLILNIYAKTN